MNKSICPKCGMELSYTPEEGSFCEFCGAKLIPKSISVQKN
jgi:rRNA maturation endonuclease Nob1